MPGKMMVPAPIDRPLSRSYIRAFAGWATAYPPGLADPTSLRTMENTMVNRDGTLRIRPGLRYLTYTGSTALDPVQGVIGSHEVFFLNNGDKAYLFALREANGSVGFRVARYMGDGAAQPFQVLALNDPLVGFNIPAGLNFSAACTYVRYLQIDNKILALSNANDSLRIFKVGAAKSIVVPAAVTVPAWNGSDKPRYRFPDQATVGDPVAHKPLNSVTNRTAKTLLQQLSVSDPVQYNIGYFYTFSNEIGESAPSQVTVFKLRRPWSGWLWQTPNASSEPSGTETDDDTQVCDQIFVYPSNGAFTNAVNQGATKMNVYAVMWSDQDPPPVEGVLVGTRDLTAGLAYEDAWVRHSPAAYDDSRTMPLPSQFNRINYSDPSKARQGLVASDRLILVNDPAAGAVIRWGSNQLGDYTNFTASHGGGYKTLTSGNLYIPACVKLWQDPRSNDMLTILCLGVDGYSTSFYMAPASVSSQSEQTNIMGFEETTATPGTSSPYGCEVMNNALYHPLEIGLMKSVAANWNINHSMMTDDIVYSWQALKNKEHIVSAQHDNRLYFLVNNPAGAALEAGCWGNEVWVFDGQAKAGSWSRWLVQAQSLRKVEVDGRVLMSVTRPDGIFAFDDLRYTDEYVAAGRAVSTRPIAWKIETNTNGANRAHDAWCHLQQAGIGLGNFTGKVRWGLRGWNVHGQPVDVSKLTQDDGPASPDGLPWDVEDFLRVAQDMKEWSVYAGSEIENGVVQPSTGQVNLVSYRYTPVSVNVGYDQGSIETYEYVRNVTSGNNALIVNGIPVPSVDTRRP